MDRLLVLLVVLALTGAGSAWWRAREGRVRARPDLGSPWEGLPVEAADVVAAVAADTPLILVEFTAPGCHPCATTRVLLDQLAADRADVSVTAVDVGDVPELVRAHRIMRAPTTLLITAQGHLLGRVSGVPRPEALRALLDASGDPQGAVASPV